MGIKDGGVNIVMDLDIDDIDMLKDKYFGDNGCVKLKTLKKKWLIKRRQMMSLKEALFCLL